MSSPLIEKILNLGSDQVGSQFDIFFLRSIPDFPIPPDLLQFRIVDDFQIPSDKIVTKEIWSRGKKIIKQVPKEESDKTLTINFTLDSGWIVYNALHTWQRNCLNTKYMNSSKNQKDLRTDITFKAKPGFKLITFKNCRILELEVTAFNHSSGDPNKVRAVFSFLAKEEDIDSLSF
jgi:hypothetical protein